MAPARASSAKGMRMGLRLVTREDVERPAVVVQPSRRAEPPAESRAPIYALGVATVSFVALFTVLVLYKHAHLGTRAFDLGIFDQGLWLLSEGETPFVTIRGLHLFGDHTSFLLYPLVPLYWVWADVRILLILTVLAMAAGGPLVYAAARAEGLGRAPAAVLGGSFLLLPAVQWQIWDVFHPETLTIPILLAAYLLALRRRPAWALLALAVALLAKEDTALIVIPLAIYLGFRARSKLLGWGGVALGLVAFWLSFGVFLPHWSPTGELIYSGRYARFGEGFADLAWGLVTSPLAVAGELLAADSLIYQAGLLVPFLVALAAPRVLLIGVPTLLANVLSIHLYQAKLEYHYTAYLIVVVAIAGVVGAKRILHRPSPITIKHRRQAMALVVVAAAIGSVVGGPWGIGVRNPWEGHADSADLVAAALDVIPPDAAVAADSRLAVHLAHRQTIYAFPNPMIRQNWSVAEAPPPPRHDFEWLAVRSDLEGMSTQFMAAYAEAMESGAFEVVFSNAEVVVWQRVEERSVAEPCLVREGAPGCAFGPVELDVTVNPEHPISARLAAR